MNKIPRNAMKKLEYKFSFSSIDFKLSVAESPFVRFKRGLFSGWWCLNSGAYSISRLSFTVSTCDHGELLLAASRARNFIANNFSSSESLKSRVNVSWKPAWFGVCKFSTNDDVMIVQLKRSSLYSVSVELAVRSWSYS